MRDITEVKFYAGSKEERLPDFTSDFPYIATRVAMDRYPGRSAPWHWHGAVELSYTKQGCMEYHTPGGVHEKLPAPAGVPPAAGKQGVRHGDRTALRPGRRPKIPARGRPTLELKTYFEEKTGCSIYTLIPADGGKGEGIRRILSFYHLDRSEALAFGDGDNDIEMLQAVGHGVAMGNASARLKAADDICGDVTEDGVYHYCLAHLL